MIVQMWELSQNDGPSAKCLVSAKMFNVDFYVYPMSICLVLKMYSYLYLIFFLYLDWK